MAHDLEALRRPVHRAGAHVPFPHAMWAASRARLRRSSPWRNSSSARRRSEMSWMKPCHNTPPSGCASGTARPSIQTSPRSLWPRRNSWCRATWCVRSGRCSPAGPPGHGDAPAPTGPRRPAAGVPAPGPGCARRWPPGRGSTGRRRAGAGRCTGRRGRWRRPLKPGLQFQAFAQRLSHAALLGHVAGDAQGVAVRQALGGDVEADELAVLAPHGPFPPQLGTRARYRRGGRLVALGHDHAFDAQAVQFAGSVAQ